MHRRMGHRHDARVVVSVKPFVEELDEKVARGEQLSCLDHFADLVS